MRARIAWFLAAATLVLVVADVVVTAQYRALLSEAAVAVHGFPFVSGAVLGCSVMGVLIVSRDHRHPIGWLLTVIGFTSAVSLLCEAYSIWVTTEGGPGTRALGGVTGWLSTFFGGQLAIAGIGLMFLLAPDGHFLSRRWRYVAWAMALGQVLCMAGLAISDPTRYDIEADADRSTTLQTALFSAGFLLISIGVLASLVSMVLRWRRSQGEQRQQVRLIAASAALISIGLVALFVVQLFNGGRQTWAASLPLYISYLLLPILFAVAVLRYRLYDIEVIINRTVVLAVGTTFAAVGYTGLVVAIAALVNTQTNSFWLSLLATALVAIAFQPLRRRVVHLANRIAYGSRALPYEALADFSRRLAETPSPQTLLPAVAEAAGRAVSAQRSTAALRVTGSEGRSAVWPPGAPEGTADYEVLVRDGGDVLGSIGVTMPKGHPLRAADLRLLQGLADQAALALRNAAIEAELAGHVATLNRTTQALAESRRRIIAADDAARRQLESAISREVLPHLETMPAQLSSLSVAASGPVASDQLEQLVTRTNAALESLRELTRGVFPTQLVRAGLPRALRSHLARRGLAAALHVEPSADRRFPASVEAAVYFCCAEALRAGSGSARIDLLVAGQDLIVRISGFARDEVDVQSIVDRVEAVGGSPSLTDADVLTVRIPVGVDEPAPAPV